MVKRSVKPKGKRTVEMKKKKKAGMAANDTRDTEENRTWHKTTKPDCMSEK